MSVLGHIGISCTRDTLSGKSGGRLLACSQAKHYNTELFLNLELVKMLLNNYVNYKILDRQTCFYSQLVIRKGFYI